MLSRVSKLLQGESRLGFRGVSAGVSVLVLLGGSVMGWGAIANARPLFPQAQASETEPKPDDSAEQPDDVVVDTDSKPGDSQPTSGTPTASNVRFSCQFVNGQHVVMYNPESQPNRFYPWATPSALGGGWSPERRCNEISRRLESYRPDGLLEMQNGQENGYNTVCVTTEKVPGCRIVFTVPPGQDPMQTRNRVFENLSVADSGQQTTAVNTYVADGKGGLMREVTNILSGLSNLGRRPTSQPSSLFQGGINLRPFLDPADGGTGQYLKPGASPTQRPGLRLNPDRFR